jgi:Ca2+-binding EF-hand superfamily protein
VGYGASPEENPNLMMMQESHSQAQHSKNRIAKEQNYEKVQQKLYDEFKLLDLDDDGNISFDEIVAFIKSKVSCVTI